MKTQQQLSGLILLLLLTSLLVVVSCQKEPEVSPEPEATTFWQTEDPEQHNFDLDSLQLAMDRAALSSSFYALLVIRNDKIVVEEYFRGKSANTLYQVRSITKNFTSATAGIAIEENLLGNLDLSLGDFIAEASTGEKKDITIRHLLNMTSGLRWNEDNEVLPLINGQIPDAVQALIGRPLQDTPGATFNYNSVSPHIVSQIIADRSGQSFLDYTKEKLLDPLGITRYAWEREQGEVVWGGFGLQLRPRDLAKLGKLYLDGGSWEGNQLVPAEWVRESGNPQVQLEPPSNGYSLQWWTSSNFGGELFYGLGYGGQALMILPDKDLLVIALQEHFVPTPQHRAQWRNFADNIFPTIYRAAK